jgi:hypothetical protein
MSFRALGTFSVSLALSLMLAACGSDSKQEDAGALFERLDARVAAAHAEQQDLYDLADRLEQEGQMLQLKADDMATALAELENTVARLQAAYENDPDAFATAQTDRDDDESNGKDADDDDEGGGLGKFLFGLIVVILVILYLRRRKARKEEEEAWRNATYTPPTYTPSSPPGEPAAETETAPDGGVEANEAATEEPPETSEQKAETTEQESEGESEEKK